VAMAISMLLEISLSRFRIYELDNLTISKMIKEIVFKL